MGASNFGRLINATTIYSLLTGDEDEETNEWYYPDEFDYKEVLEDIQGSLSEIGYNTCTNEWYKNDRVLAEYSENTSFGDIDIEIIVKPIIESGYHEGARLDYHTFLYIYGCGNEEIGDVEADVDYMFESSDMNKGMITIQKRNAVKWINKQLIQINEQLEKVFKMHADHELEVVATFSNGETIYKAR